MVGRAGLGFLQVAILARLLGPADFGMMALATAVIVFAQIFTDMGVSNAIVHHQQVSQEELSSLYWLNVLAGGGMMLLLMLSSPFVAWFYNTPSLKPLLAIVSINFLVIAIGQQLRVMAEKELRFAELARIELTAAIFGFGVAVTWAFIWPSVFALVAGMIASTMMTMVLSWRNLANGWRPMMRLRLGEIRHFLGFGGYTMANNLVNTFNMQADIFIGGRFLSVQALGVYSLPRDLSLRVAGVINPIVTRVGLPVMARVQNNQALLKSVYLKTLRMTASVNFPVYMAMAIFAPEFVALLFGAQWSDAVPLLRILALWGLLRSTGNPAGSLIFAVGRADLAFKWNLTLLLMVSPLLWVGAQYGNQGIALALLAMAVVFAVPGWYVLVRPLCGAGFIEYFKQLLIPLMVALLSSTIAYVAVWPFSDLGVRLGLGLSIGGLGYLILSRLLNRTWFEAILELLMRNKINE